MITEGQDEGRSWEIMQSFYTRCRGAQPMEIEATSNHCHIYETFCSSLLGYYITARCVCFIKVQGELERQVHPRIHAYNKQTTLPCCFCTNVLSPLRNLSPQRMITRFHRAVTAPVPVLIVPAGRPLLPLSPCIITPHMVLLAYGGKRGPKRFIRIYFCSFCGPPMECYGASAAGRALRFKRSNSP